MVTTDSVDLVVGGTGGIGRAICLRLSEAGRNVALTYHKNKDVAEEIVGEITSNGQKSSCSALDLGNEQEISDYLGQLKADYGRIDNVIYAAGPSFDFNFIGNIPAQEWKAVMEADVNGCFNLAQEAVRVFRAQGGGHMLSVITSAVERYPVADILSAAPKAAIEIIMRGIAKESGRAGIRANCVGPGWVDAGMGKRAVIDKLSEKEIGAVLKSIPLGRMGQAEDIANAVAFLCSDQAAYITGQSIAVDGGLQL